MVGFFLVGLLIIVWELLTEIWPLLLSGLAMCLLARWVAIPVALAAATDARDRLRHERARRQIDRIASQTSRTMLDAALARAEVVERRAMKIRDR